MSREGIEPTSPRMLVGRDDHYRLSRQPRLQRGFEYTVKYSLINFDVIERFKSECGEVRMRAIGNILSYLYRFTLLFVTVDILFRLNNKLLLFLKVVEGSTNFYSVFIRNLNPNINARYLRISPQYWNKYPCLRADFLGCSPNEGNGKSFCVESPGYDKSRRFITVSS